MTIAAPRWIAGPGVAVVWPGGMALMAPDTSPALAERVWTRLRREPQLGTFLKALSETAERGFLDLPPFAIAVVNGGHCHVAVRGGYKVLLEGHSGTETLSGVDITTWAERVVATPDRVVFSAPGIDLESESAPLGDGIVPAGALLLGEPAPAPVSAPASSASPSRPAEPSPQPAPAPEAVAPPPVPEAAAPPLVLRPSEPTLAPDATAAPPAEPQADDEDEDEPAEAEALEPNPYLALFAPSEVELPETPVPARAAPSSAAPSSGQPPADQLFGDTIADDGLGELISFPSAALASAPQVLGRFCDRGHANPPERGRCFVCGSLVSGEERMTSRPQLGWVKVEGGEAIPINGPIIAGRNPSSTALRLSQAPRLLAIPHAHVSSTHLAFLVEGWRVLVRDLRSSNGTFLRRNGKPPIRLPESPYPLVPEDLIDLGKGVFIHLDRIP